MQIAAMALATALAAGHPAPATLDLQGPAGAQLSIDDRAAGRLDDDGRMVVLLSAEPHRLTVTLDGRVVESREVTFGPGTRARLEMGERR